MATKKKTNIEKDVNYYLNLPWTYTIETTMETGQKIYVIHVNELPGVATDASTVELAMDQIKEVMTQIFKLDIEEGIEIPEPLNINDYKGNIAYRTTPQRHYQIAREAKRKNLSLSQLIDAWIDSAQSIKK